ncbi:MAG: methyltransferase domain-containing protein [Bacteroidota bacterium]
MSHSLKNNSCILCLHTDFKTLGTPRINLAFPRNDQSNYNIMQCRSCGYYFVYPPIDLTQHEWQSLYESDYFEVAKKTPWQINLNKKELQTRMAQINQHIGCQKGRFLDMGCGEGFMLQEAASNGFEPHGLDIANNLTPELTEKYNFINGSVFDAHFPDDYFSVVYMDSVLEHVPKPVQTINELKRILKPGGILLVVVPNEDSLMNSIAKWLYTITFNRKKYGKIKPFVTPYHIQGFNKKSLHALFQPLNMSVLVLKGFGGNYTFWKAHPRFSKHYFVSLFTYPFGLLSVVIGRQIQLMSLLRK